MLENEKYEFMADRYRALCFLFGVLGSCYAMLLRSPTSVGGERMKKEE